MIMSTKSENMTENTIILEFDTQVYKEEDVDTFINETSQIIQLKKQPFSTFAETGTAIIVLVVLSPLIYFTRGFFTKLGEMVAEEEKENAIKTYRFFKEKLIKLLRSSITKRTPTTTFKLKNKDTRFEITGSFTSDDENTISVALDSIKELSDLALEKLTKIQISSDDRVRIISFRFNSQNMNWEFDFAQTYSGEITR